MIKLTSLPVEGFKIGCGKCYLAADDAGFGQRQLAAEYVERGRDVSAARRRAHTEQRRQQDREQENGKSFQHDFILSVQIFPIRLRQTQIEYVQPIVKKM